MILLLAQTIPDANQIASWLSVLFYLGGFIATLLGGAVAIKELRKPAAESPLQVQKAAGVVTEDELTQTHGRITRERKEIDGEVNRVEEQLGNRMETLEGKIDANTSMTSEIRGKVELINQQLSQVLNQMIRR